MKLNVRQAAKLLSVSEREIYHWVEAGEIPCSITNHQPVFSRAELLEYATAHRLPTSVALFEDGEEAQEPLRLVDALRRGGVYHGVGGGDREAVLRSMVEHLPLPAEQDRGLLVDVLLAREALGSTAIGDGIAIPHVRSPLIFPGMHAAVALCYLQIPVSFDAPDGKPVHSLFALISPTIRGHLQLLSRLSLALLDPGFKAAVLRKANGEDVIAEAVRVEAAIAQAPLVAQRPKRR